MFTRLGRPCGGIIERSGHAASLFEKGLVTPFTLYVNLRFLTCLFAVLMAFEFGALLRRRTGRTTCAERRHGFVLYWIAGILLLLVLSVESYLYARKAAGDAQAAAWSSQMALSLTWGVFAAALLAVGFWKRARAVRLAALALFALAACKLVLVDIAGVRQMYRILCFFVMGLLMIGSAYLYHKAEQRLGIPEAGQE